MDIKKNNKNIQDSICLGWVLFLINDTHLFLFNKSQSLPYGKADRRLVKYLSDKDAVELD